MQVLLYSKPDCHLCHVVKADLLDLASEIGFVLQVQDIQTDPTLFERFRYLIPVVDIENGPLLYPPIDFLTLHQALIAAKRTPSTPSDKAAIL
ncbi:MAG: glutaredoxin family protein [Caldilineaceae bacterium]|nr:glutaredoxin family protein [Caldilineaceae bacterium]MBP8110296.1 glutaredoxin family protein [Caldilineaceae bacterium]